MSDTSGSQDHDADRKPETLPVAAPNEMRLHPQRPMVTRLSRKVLIGLGAVTAAAIAGALFIALRPQLKFVHVERHTIAPHAPPDAVSALPRNYAELPKGVDKLGPPLPGDLGPAIHSAGVTQPAMAGSQSLTPAEQRQEAALTSHLFAPTQNVRQQTSPQSTSAPTNTSPANGAGPIPASSDGKLAFMNAPADQRTVSPDRLQSPMSPYLLQAGSVIPAALITGLNSDLPGEITAQVTQDCYDSVTGTFLLIPQGSRLIGLYDAQTSFGQNRALLVWTRLILPNGKSIVLERLPGTDTQGYAGLEDQVDNHWSTLFKAAVLSTVLSVGSEAGTSTGNSQNSLAQAIRQGASQSFSQVGEQVVGHSLDVQPTITIRPGFSLDVLVERDLVLEPYKS